MKKRVLTGLVVGLAILGMAGMAFATNLVTYEYTINGAALMSYSSFASGVAGDSAAANLLFDGARLYRGNDSRSFVATQNAAFTTWATTTTDRLVDFNLWGYDGRGANWGEVYKVYDWGTPTASSGAWSGYTTPWPSSWGSFDDYANGKPGYETHYNGGELLGWDTGWNDTAQLYTGYANGLGFGAGAKPSFTFSMTLDMDNPAFGYSSPFAADGKTIFWFGGSMADASGNFINYYEGNIALQGTQVPEPGTLILLGSGLLGLVGLGRKKFRK